MKLFCLFLLAASEEPGLIGESSTEGALSDREAKIIACLNLAHSVVIEYEGWSKDFIAKSKHDAVMTKNKMAADLLYNCMQVITLEQAALVDAKAGVDMSDPLWRHLVSFDEEQFSNPFADITVRPEQQALIDEIRLVIDTQTINELDGVYREEGYDPTDFPTETSREGLLMMVTAAVGGLIVIGVVLLAVKVSN
jgi:hypothetical protein